VLVEGDRGDAGLLNDRFDRRRGGAFLGDQPLGGGEDPLALTAGDRAAGQLPFARIRQIDREPLREVLHGSEDSSF
jgi:hypothetical protein